jgi:hypothetical protein
MRAVLSTCWRYQGRASHASSSSVLELGHEQHANHLMAPGLQWTSVRHPVTADPDAKEV